MTTFKPDDKFRKTVELLAATHSPIHQIAATQQIKALAPRPEFQNSLMAVLLQGGRLGIPDEVRQSAGLLVKNHVRRYSAEQQACVKRLALMLLSDPSRIVRGVAGTIIAYVARTTGISQWPELAPTLLTNLKSAASASTSSHTAVGTLSTLWKIVVDTGDLILSSGQSELDDQFTTCILFYLRHQDPKCRILALTILTVLTYQQPPAFDVRISDIIKALSSLCADPNIEVQKELILTLCSIVEVYIKFPVFQDGPTFAAICAHMFRSVFHTSDAIVQAALIFWMEAGGHDIKHVRQTVFLYLPKLLPELVKKCQLQPDDPHLLDVDDDWSIPDRPQDAVPRCYATVFYTDDGECDDDDDNDDDEDYGVYGDIPTTRRKAGKALSSLAETYGGRLLPMVMPCITAAIGSQGPGSHLIVEAGICALGAIGEWCQEDLAPYMPKLMPWLNRNLRSEQAVVAHISCWLLGQFGQWLVSQSKIGNPAPLSTSIDAVLSQLLNPKKSIQYAALSCLAHLIEASGEHFGPFVWKTLQAIHKGCQRYQMKSVAASLDVIRTLAESASLKSIMQDENISNATLRLLLERWRKLTVPSDRLHLGIMEVMFLVLPNLHGPTVLSTLPFICKQSQALFMHAATQLATVLQTSTDSEIRKHAMDDWFEFLVDSVYLIDRIVEIVEADFMKLPLDKNLIPALLKIVIFKNVLVNNAVFRFPTLNVSVVNQYREMSSNCIWAYSEALQRAPIEAVTHHVSGMIAKVRDIMIFWRSNACDAEIVNLSANCNLFINLVGQKAPLHLATAFEGGQLGSHFLWLWLIRLAHVPLEHIQVKIAGTMVVVNLLRSKPRPFVATMADNSGSPMFRNASALFDLVDSWVRMAAGNPGVMTSAIRNAVQFILATVKQAYSAPQNVWPTFLQELRLHRSTVVANLGLE